MKEGSEVGSRRWPAASNHPDCWGKPWRGVILNQYDPRAWEHTLAFPMDNPDPELVRQYVVKCIQMADAPSGVPVLWDFGEEGHIVYWERGQALSPYADDLADWEECRERAYKSLGLSAAIAKKAKSD